ncbi:serine/threonine protein phosphatase PP1 regulatory subunit Sds22 [Schizosaccharomyces osmophilus]|uniref:Serine/threonine protein phosphatase PP1 regulatory subunit Sds22 n=1 Tax=Schizosaccharomyces osmophilus TaxID=2545709 RepID=A0AAF0AWF1_9SCHI|nr:serine/threonine protein phosphatase PP1 regulatory subunit Sds22 [Schizosaccharomyces osmophilus]WBW73562.1 serine/threonine protein phosphatase PP1 regulatory subunit Sds22 [Schizosaccharomyces osmophilus]
MDVNSYSGSDQLIHDDLNVQQIDADEDLLEEFPDDTEVIDLVQSRITSIKALGLERFHRLDSLCLRQNQIRKIECLPKNLTELDLYDNLLRQIENLDEQVHLKNLDLSFNNIKVIENVSHLKELENLYFVQNRIRKIENLEGLTKLENLELGGNKIRAIENLDTLTNIDKLWLGKNKITKLENLEKLQRLSLLSIQANRITRFENLNCLSHCLRELYISHNGLTSFEGIEVLENLQVLDVSNNYIKHLSHLKGLKNLQEFWASSNEFDSFQEIEDELSGLEKLETVYFEGNPLQKSNPALYRNKVRLCLPNLLQIDATPTR